MLPNTRNNTLANPLDALPVLYFSVRAAGSGAPGGDGRGDTVAPLTSALSRRTPRMIVSLSVSVGVFAGILGQNIAGPGHAVLLVFMGLVSAIGTAALLIATAKPARAGAQPLAMVLSRNRLRCARGLRDLSRTDARTAAMQLAALKADWLEAISTSPPASGRLLMTTFGVGNMRGWLEDALRTGVLLALVGMAAFDVQMPLTVVMVLLATLMGLPLLKINPERSIRRRSTRALRDIACPCCGYDLNGLAPACQALPELGPARCPECAARWPVAPPPMPADQERAR